MKYSEFAERGDRALRKAVANTVEEHRRLGLPLVIFRDGEVVEVMAEEIDRMNAARTELVAEEPPAYPAAKR